MNASRHRPAEFTPTGAFAAHGQVAIEFHGRVTLSRVQGPWNVELVQHWVETFRAQQPHMVALAAQGGHVAVIAVERSAMATAEAIALMRKVTEYSMERYGLCGGGLVLPEGLEGRALAARAMAQVWEGLVPHRLFASTEDALAWAGQTLAAHDADGGLDGRKP